MTCMGIVTLTGPRVVLRAVQPEDEQSRRGLGWHASIERCYGHEDDDRAMSAGEARDWYAEQVRLAGDPARRHWMLEAQGRLAGVAFLHHIDETDRRARYAIGMFAPEFIGRGLGTEATRLVLQHAFTAMSLHRVDLRVLAFNEAAIAAYRRCGFVLEGRERETCWLGGRWHDDLVMGVLADEYLATG
jgi:[ribosomal protein S5]-alanine N-acetyltransferase